MLQISQPEVSAERFNPVANALQANATHFRWHRHLRQSHPVVRNRQNDAIAPVFEHHPRGRCVRMSVDVDQGFLRHHEHRLRNEFIDARPVAFTFEARQDPGAFPEPEREGLHCRTKVVIAQFDRVVEKCQRPNLAINLTDDALNLLNQVVVSRISLHLPQMGDAQLERHEQLAGSVVKLLAHPTAFIIVDQEQLV